GTEISVDGWGVLGSDGAVGGHWKAMRLAGLSTCAAALGVSLVASPALALRPDKSLGTCSIQAWDVKNGLPSAAIRALAQAPDGALWVATLGGLLRYDGTGFLAVRAPEELRGIAGETNKILAARDGRIWLASAFQPPLLFSEGALHRFGPEAGLPAGAASAWAESARGDIWVGTNKGLFRLAEGRLVAHAVPGADERLPTAIALDPAGTVWVGTSKGLYTVTGAELAP